MSGKGFGTALSQIANVRSIWVAHPFFSGASVDGLLGCLGAVSRRLPMTGILVPNRRVDVLFYGILRPRPSFTPMSAIRTRSPTLFFGLQCALEVRPRIPSLAEPPLHSSQVLGSALPFLRAGPCMPRPRIRPFHLRGPRIGVAQACSNPGEPRIAVIISNLRKLHGRLASAAGVLP